MQRIKIYSRTLTPLTTLTEVDFNALDYGRRMNEIGDASFTVRLDRKRITDANLKHYNRIEIIDDGVVKFFGVITKRSIKLDTAEIRCREIGYIFKKRIMGASYAVSGNISTLAADLLTAVNGAEATGITADVGSSTGNVNTTFNRANAYDILAQICKATGNQFEFTPDRKLHIAPTIGTDKSASVIFKYNASQIASANILKFEVDDSGDDIVTKAYGKSDALSSAQENAGLKSDYGLLESYKDFRVVNTQGVLDQFTGAEVRDRLYSPGLELSPKVGDTFELGDLVRVVLRNSLVNLDNSYQVLEKKVQYKGGQRTIIVRINDLPNQLATILSDRDRRLELLEKET